MDLADICPLVPLVLVSDADELVQRLSRFVLVSDEDELVLRLCLN